MKRALRCWNCGVHGYWLKGWTGWYIAELGHDYRHNCYEVKARRKYMSEEDKGFYIVVTETKLLPSEVATSSCSPLSLEAARELAKKTVEQYPDTKAYVCKASEVFETQRVVSRRLV